MENIVNAVISANGKLLTVKRKTEPRAGMYGLPGGHVEEGETKMEALKREVKEETSFEIALDGSDFLGTERAKYKLREFNISFYKARIISGEGKPQKEEIEEIKWLDPGEFFKNLKEFGFSSDEVEAISKIIKSADS